MILPLVFFAVSRGGAHVLGCNASAFSFILKQRICHIGGFISIP